MQESHPKEKKTVCEGDHNRNKNGGSLLLPFNQSIGNKNPDLYLQENGKNLHRDLRGERVLFFFFCCKVELDQVYMDLYKVLSPG